VTAQRRHTIGVDRRSRMARHELAFAADMERCGREE
jgi:hypothetical protein